MVNTAALFTRRAGNVAKQRRRESLYTGEGGGVEGKEGVGLTP